MTTTEDPLASGVPSPSSTLCDDVNPFERTTFFPSQDPVGLIHLPTLPKSNDSLVMSEPCSSVDEAKVASDTQQRDLDVERLALGSEDDFPEGGWTGWAAVMGCFLACQSSHSNMS